MSTKTKPDMNLVSKKEIQTINRMAKDMAKAMTTIDLIYSQFRELVGFAETDVSIFEKDADLLLDTKGLAENLIEHCVDARSNWNEY